MSNIAGKAYAMNVVTPIKWYWRWLNKFIFWTVNSGAMKLVGASLNGLTTLSLIHYARWAIVKPNEFPRLSESQPKETIKYSYMFFFSNFNGSWAQYVDSFHSAIPSGLDLFWKNNVKYPLSATATLSRLHHIKSSMDKPLLQRLPNGGFERREVWAAHSKLTLRIH